MKSMPKQGEIHLLACLLALCQLRNLPHEFFTEQPFHAGQLWTENLEVAVSLKILNFQKHIKKLSHSKYASEF